MKLTITVDPELRRKLDPAELRRVLRLAAEVAANEVKAEARPYPGASNSPVIWASDNQRKAYFAKRNEQGLPYQYTRQSDSMSERIMESWSIAPYGDIGARLSQSASYAPYVIGEQQQPQHAATGWRKLSDIVNEMTASGKIVEAFNKVIAAFLK